MASVRMVRRVDQETAECVFEHMVDRLPEHLRTLHSDICQPMGCHQSRRILSITLPGFTLGRYSREYRPLCSGISAGEPQRYNNRKLGGR